MIFVHNKGLSKELIHHIEERMYSTEEIIALSIDIKEEYTKKKRGLFSAMIMLFICFAFVMILQISSSTSVLAMFGLMVVMIAILTIAMIYVKKNVVDKEKQQFEKAVKKGYPELIERIREEYFL